MIYGSVCSGIESATVAWHPLGWTPAWFSEIERFPSRLLSHYYPDVPNLGDMLKIEQNETFQKTAIDLLVGGTPCQSFSTAGLRGGLADARGNLALEFCRILAVKRPKWFVWENVPGVFSSSKGEDFRSIITGFRECGYSISWRTMDAQFFGVPQRRRRVFVVGYLGDDWRPSAAVLFEPEGLRRDTSARSGERESVAGSITRCSKGRQPGVDEAANGKLIAGTIDASYGRLQGASGQDGGHGHSTLVFGGNNTAGPIDIATAVNSAKSASGRMDFESESFVVSGETKLFSIMPMNSSKDYKAREVNVTQPITTNQGISNNGGDIILSKAIVRRLTPTECERLQGFPDFYTAIPGAADSPRYEVLGNSMAVPVMRWIGERIDKYDKIFR